MNRAVLFTSFAAAFLTAGCAAPRPQAAAPQSPLMQAVLRRDAAAVQTLLDAGHEPDAVEAPGISPIRPSGHRMPEVQESPAMRLLVQRCVRRAAEGRPCENALAAAAMGGFAEETDKLAASGGNLDELLSTTLICGHAATARVLIKHGAKAREPGASLAQALVQGHTEIVQLLLENGAPPDGAGSNGIPHLSLAAYYDNVEAVQLLIAKGAPIAPALADLQRTERYYARSGIFPDQVASARRGIELIQRLREKRSVMSEGVSKEDLAILVKAAVEGAVKSAPNAPVAPTYSSDVDIPGYRKAERPEHYAVVIGIERYADLPPAEFAERDAEAVKNHLIALGFPSRNVVHLAGERAGYKAIEKFVETWLPRQITEKSSVIFYFSGHGAPDPASGSSYLLPWDGDPGYLENTGYSLSRLYAKLAGLKAREIAVVLDSCFSGAGGRSVLAKGARPLVTQIRSSVPARLAVFAATSENQITSAKADQGHGTFTYHFLKGLSGEARDASGTVTAAGLLRYLQPKVADDARRQNREQMPVLMGAQPDLVLTGQP